MRLFENRIALSAAVAALLSLSAPLTQDATAQQDQNDRQGQRGERGDRGDNARGDRGGRGGGGDWQRGRRGGGGGGNWQTGRGGRGGGGGGGFMGGLGQLMRPYFARRDMPIFVQELDLDESQRTVVEMLILDYENRFDESLDSMREEMRALRPQPEEDPERDAQRDELRTKMRDQMQKFREIRRNAENGEELDQEALNQMREEMRAMQEQMEELRPPRPEPEEIQQMAEDFTGLYNDWRGTRTALNAEFISGVQVVLTEQQLDAFPAFERTLRRAKTLNDGRLSGERVDLIHTIRQIRDIENELEDMSDLLDSYSLELDAALVARNAFTEESRSQMGQSFANRDFDSILEVMEEESTYRMAVRDVNRTYADIIGSALGDMFNPQIREEFDTAWRDAAYPQVYRPSIVTRSFEAIYGWEEFDPEILEAVKAIEEAYNAELASMNERLVATTIEAEPGRTTRFMESRIARMNGEDIEQPADPIRELEGERRDMDQRYREQIEALLTPEQIEELPQNRRRGGWGGGNAQDREAMRAQFIERFDKDGDGELSEEERAAAREAIRLMQRGNNDDI